MRRAARGAGAGMEEEARLKELGSSVGGVAARALKEWRRCVGFDHVWS